MRSLKRMAVRLVVATTTLAALVACQVAESETSNTAWQVLAKQIGPNGEVTKELALDAFATFIGPMPGGRAEPGSSLGMSSGTLANRWLGRHWSSLTDDQRTAAITRVSETSDSSDRTKVRELQAFVDAIALEFREGHQSLDVLPPIVQNPLIGPSPVHAATFPGGADGEPLSGGAASTCLITFHSSAVSEFDKLQDPTLDSNTRSRALRIMGMVTAHELMHCHQLKQSGDVKRWHNAPDWVAEGSAEWGGYLFAAPNSELRGLNRWDEFFLLPNQSLFRRTYEAVGFWSHLADPWSRINEAMRKDWENQPNAVRNSYSVLADAQAEYAGYGMSRWAMKFLRRPSLGEAWQFRAPGLGADVPPAAEVVPLGPGMSHQISSAPLAFAYADFSYESEVEVVSVEPHAEGAVHWGKSTDGDDDLFKEESGALWFCTQPGKCECPEGTSMVVPLADREYTSMTLSAFGYYPSEIAAVESIQPRVAVSAWTMEAAAEIICEDIPPEYDLSVCEAYFSRAALAATVPRMGDKSVKPGGHESVPALSSTGEVGATGIFCRWTIWGDPQDDEPWFAYSLDYTLIIVVRGSESAAEFAQRREVMLSSRPCRMLGVDSVPLCVSTTDATIDVIGPSGENIFVYASSGRSQPSPDVEDPTDDGASDLSEDQAREATQNLVMLAIRALRL
jgi:hypothetical protein